jgi:hypothetical protein
MALYAPKTAIFPVRNAATINLITTRRRPPGLRDSPVRVQLAGCHVLAELGYRKARQRCPEPNLFPVLEPSFRCVGFELP